MKNAYLTGLLVAVICAALPASVVRAAEWQEFEISGTTGSQQAQKPDIYGDIVVWQQLVGSDYDIYAADITNPESPSVFIVAAYADDQNEPAIYENTVVWQGYVAGTGWNIYGTDVSNPAALFPICTLGDDQLTPEIYQNTVVWQDNYDGDWDIFAADINDTCSPQEFPVAPFLGHQRSPAVYQNMVVWQDNHNGSWEIYGVILDGPKVAQCAAGMAGDVNSDCKVDFYDFAEMAANWLECGLEPREACLQ